MKGANILRKLFIMAVASLLPHICADNNEGVRGLTAENDREEIIMSVELPVDVEIEDNPELEDMDIKNKAED